METTLHRKLLLGQVHALEQILDERGISLEIPSDEELLKMPDPDLSRLARMLRDTARTPGVGR